MSSRAGDLRKSAVQTAGGGSGLVESQDLSVSKTACHRVGSDRPAAHLSSTLGKLLNCSELNLPQLYNGNNHAYLTWLL